MSQSDSDSASVQSHTHDDQINSIFSYESDHIALKGNKDYSDLLRTVALLESQRMKAIQDLDKLIDAQKVALAHPIGFVEKLQRHVDMGLPKPQKLPELPHIPWDSYTSNVDPLNMARHKHMTRMKKMTPSTSPVAHGL